MRHFPQAGGRPISQGPGYGRPAFERFRRMMDSAGPQYAEDFFYYTIDFGDIAAGNSVTKQQVVDRQTAFEWILATGGGAADDNSALSSNVSLDLTIADGASSRNLMNQGIPFAILVGDGQVPFTLPIVRRFMNNSVITVHAHNYGATTVANAELTMIGRKLWIESGPGRVVGPPLTRFNKVIGDFGKVLSEDFYSYDFSLASLAGGASQQVTVTTERDSQFEWILTTASALTGEEITTDASMALTVRVYDGGSERFLDNGPTQLGSVAGSGQFPFVLPQTRIFLGASPMTIFLKNISGTEIDNIHYTMLGRKLFEQD